MQAMTRKSPGANWSLQELLQEGWKLPQEATTYKEDACHRHCRTRVL